MATVFKPQTASFGGLVLHPRPRRLPDFARWSLVAENEDSRQARNHLFIAIGFITAFMTCLSALYVVDSAIYPQGYAHSPIAHSAPVDYD